MKLKPELMQETSVILNWWGSSKVGYLAGLPKLSNRIETSCAIRLWDQDPYKKRRRPFRRRERKGIRRIYGGICEEGRWHIRTNKELARLYGEPYIIAEVKRARLRWAMERMPLESTADCTEDTQEEGECMGEWSAADGCQEVAHTSRRPWNLEAATGQA